MPYGMAMGADGNLYVSSRFTNNVLRYDGSTGAFVDAFVPSISVPHGLTFGPGGDLFVVSNGSNAVMRYAAGTGASMGVFASGGLSFPTDLVFGPNGDLFVSSSFNNRVVRYDGTTGAYIGVFASGGLNNSQGLAFGPGSGDLFVASYSGNRVNRYDGTTGVLIGAFVSPGSGGLSQPVDIEFGPDGDLYVHNGGSAGMTLRYDGTTGSFLSAITGPSGGQGYLLFRENSSPSGRAFCLGDGSGISCPCMNGNQGAGCANSVTGGALLAGSGIPDASNDTLVLTVSDSTPTSAGLLFQGTLAFGAGAGTPLGNGLLCFTPESRWSVQFADAGGMTTYGPGLLGTHRSATPGATILYQWWYRDDADSCGGGFNFSNGWSSTWQ